MTLDLLCLAGAFVGGLGLGIYGTVKVFQIMHHNSLPRKN